MYRYVCVSMCICMCIYILYLYFNLYVLTFILHYVNVYITLTLIVVPKPCDVIKVAVYILQQCCEIIWVIILSFHTDITSRD